jgi:hypothetical protein
MNYWQIAVGDGSRDYSDVFFKFGVILVGHGRYGNYFENKELYTGPDLPAFIRVFSEMIQEEDLVILKKPHGKQWEILAVGQVKSDYSYEEVFGDVDGWDLQHCRRVHWKKPAKHAIVEGLRRGTLSKVNKAELKGISAEIWEKGEESDKPLQSLPKPQKEIQLDQLIDSLMVFGLSANNAELITNTIRKLKRLANWYNSQGRDVGEHEIRTFLIAPLITALGWAEQRIKIEWHNLDLVIFDQPYSDGAEPKIIIESKRLWDGLLYAPDQARKYAKNFEKCDYFIVTDGIRYKLFECGKRDWQYAAYVNLLSLKERHPIFEQVNGAFEFFRKMLPN